MSSYVTAKWAVHGLARALQIEARGTPGISVSLVTPGSVDTPVYRQAGTYVGVNGRPPPPVTTPEQVADAVAAALDRPVRDQNVGISNPFVIFAFRAMPDLFDVLVRPLMRLAGLSRNPVGPLPETFSSPRRRARTCAAVGSDDEGRSSKGTARRRRHAGRSPSRLTLTQGQRCTLVP